MILPGCYCRVNTKAPVISLLCAAAHVEDLLFSRDDDVLYMKILL